MTTQNQTKNQQLKSYKDIIQSASEQEADLLNRLAIIRADRVGAEASLQALEESEAPEAPKTGKKRGPKKGAAAAAAVTPDKPAGKKPTSKKPASGKKKTSSKKTSSKKTSSKKSASGKKKASGKEAPEGTGKTLKLRYAIAQAIGKDTCNADEIVTRMTKAGTLPSSKSPKSYIQMTLSTAKDLFDRPGRGSYKNKPSTLEELKKLGGKKSVSAKSTNGKANKASKANGKAGKGVDAEISDLGSNVVDNPFSG